MKKIGLIAQREIRHFFQTPFAWVILPIYLIMCGTYFNTSLDTYLSLTKPSMEGSVTYGVTINTNFIDPYLKNIFSVILFFIPLITMRSFAEEKKMCTYDLLVSYPVKPWQTLLGKYLGAVVLVFGLLALSATHLFYLFYKSEPYMPIIYTTYLGYALFVLFYVAVGIFTSLLTENQIIAAILTYLALLAAAILRWLAFNSPKPFDRFFSNFLLLEHIESFRSGIIFLGDAYLYLGITVCLLMAAQLNIRRHFTK